MEANVADTFAAADIGRLEACHRDILDLCLRLEAAAGLVEAGQAEGADEASVWRDLAAAMPALIGRAQDLEERVFFPDFDRHAGSCFAAITIERLKAEHRCDRLAAGELASTLMALAEGRCRLAGETVARMIGGFQESLRRHVLAERIMLEALIAARFEARTVFA